MTECASQFSADHVSSASFGGFIVPDTRKLHRDAKHQRRVLLAWEMGEGLGHATRLLKLGCLLRDAGWVPVVAARNPNALADQYAAEGIHVIPTPEHRSCFTGPGRFRAATFADVMGVCGYADVAQLEHMVREWDAVLDAHRPQLVIADYSPLLALAAFGRVPQIAIGDGFVTPPGLPDGSFPPLGEPRPSTWDPEALLDAACQVQKRRGLALPTSLPQILTGAGQLTSVPREIDIYAEVRTQAAAGSWNLRAAPLPPPSEARVFAYLRMNYEPSARVLQALADSGVPTECFLHDAAPDLVAALERRHIYVHREPPPLRDVLHRCSFLVHHGGIGTLEDALLAGRPQLLLPRHREQALNTQRAIKSGTGVFGVSDKATVEQLRERLPPLLADTRVLTTAQAVASRIAARHENAWAATQKLIASLEPPAAKQRVMSVNELYSHGNQLHRQKRVKEALATYQAVLKQDPGHLGARADTANALRDLGDLAGAERAYRAIVAERPRDPVILQAAGQLLRITGKLDEALDYLQRALAENDSAQLHWQIAYTLLMMGRLDAAWPHFERRHEALGLRTPHASKPRWDGSPVTNAILLVLDEQGIGDTLQFLRFLPLIPRGAGARIVFAGKSATLPLAQRLLPEGDVFSWDGPLPHSHCWIPLMSLPSLFDVKAMTDIPPPDALRDALLDPQRVARWRPVVRGEGDDRPVVAICWRGNPDFSGDAWRSPGLEPLRPLLDMPGIRFVSLHVGAAREEISKLGEEARIVDLGTHIEAEGLQILDTLAVLANCDYVVSSCTSIAHMAGTVGVRGCVLLSIRPDWRWMLQRSDTPWYPSLTLLRQTTQGDWAPVVAEAAELLR
jgi:tetratricopeptide (TPR) repeat protein